MLRLLFTRWLTVFTVFTAAALLGNAPPASAQAPAYAPTYLDPVDLGTLGGNETRAHAEKAGRIVGASQTSDGAIHAFKYEQGAMTDLGTLGGTTSWAFAINSAGSIVGSASVGGDLATHAFLWTQTDGMMDLGTLGGTYSRAAGINDDGQVAGWAQMPGDTAYHAFVWDATNGMQDLGTFGGESSFAYDIAAGMVCGEAMLPDGSSHAFTRSTDGLLDLGTLGGTYSAAINCGDPAFSRRPVVGESSIAGDGATHAVSWDQRGVVDRGTLGGAESRALRTSIWGEIFGESQTAAGDTHPFQLWRGLVDFSQVLGDDSRIESVVPISDMRARAGTVVSGTAFGQADVHAYIASVPLLSEIDPSTARTITTGVFDVISLGRAELKFQAGDTAGDVHMNTQFGRCYPCAARDTVSLSVARLVSAQAGGSATVRGNSYPSVSMPQVRIDITADSFIVPDTGERSLTISSPFTFSGFVLGATQSDWQMPDRLFGIPLSGKGTVTLQLFSCETCVLGDGRRYYDQRELKYSFEGQ
jgi:probable HAF family extracellular repeat protein